MIKTHPVPMPKESDPYLQAFATFEREALDKAPSWEFPIRKAALARFADLGFPTLQQEDWRFTNVSAIAHLPFKPVLQPSGALTANALTNLTWAKLPAHRIVFVNGHFAPHLSVLPKLATEVHISPLSHALAAEPHLLQNQLARYVRPDDNPFVALNTAFFRDGALIRVPAGKQVSSPIHIIYFSDPAEPGQFTNCRNLVVVEKGAGATILETDAGKHGASYVSNCVTEVVLGERAVLEFSKFQDESLDAFHLSALHAQLARGCNFVFHSFAAGAKIARNNIKTVLAGEGIECVLNGLYLAKGDQIHDHFMIVEHAQPHCNSHEYFNGILDDESRGVFHGRILVRPDAQKTDAKQTNKNLLLSDGATANTKPQLEIYADDVKCTHGATIGQLNDESIFYLRARGIGLDTARRMLIHAFASEITERIRHEPAREELDAVIWDRLEQNPRIGHHRPPHV